MGPVRDPQGCRTAALRTRKGIDTTRISKTPARASYLAVRAPQGLFTGCLQSLNPYGAHKLIMHALKLYGPRTGRQNSYGAARAPCGPREWTYEFCSKQPGNSPYGARECDVTEALLCWIRSTLSKSLRQVKILPEELLFEYFAWIPYGLEVGKIFVWVGETC